MTGSLTYRLAGVIIQGDTGQPDSLARDIASAGRGSGMRSVGSRSLVGIGNTTAPGYVHAVHEETLGWRSVCDGRMDEVELVYFTDLIIFSGLISHLNYPTRKIRTFFHSGTFNNPFIAADATPMA